MRKIATLALCALLTACMSEGLPDPGDAICRDPAGALGLCYLPDGSPTDQSMPWFSRAACGPLLWGARVAIGEDGARLIPGEGPGAADRNAPSECSPEGEPLCADGSAPRCEWWAVPDQDWQETCADLIREAGLSEADCYVPMAPYPDTTVDPSRIYIEP